MPIDMEMCLSDDNKSAILAIKTSGIKEGVNYLRTKVRRLL